MIPKITEGNEHNFFNDKEEGLVFNYSSSFDPKEVEKIANKKGIEVEYCRPKTPEYKAHGCFTMKIVSIKK